MSFAGVRMTVPVFGTVLMVIYTMLITMSDAITKYLAQFYEAPQLLSIVALLIVLMSFGSGRIASRRGTTKWTLRTACPRAMALRAMLTVLATLMFFHALAKLPLAEVFLFIAMIPLFSALMSGPILGEHVRFSAWVALASGFVGLICMFEVDMGSVQTGHICALVGAVSGTASIVLARYIGRFETNSHAQVFYPQAAVFLTMVLLAPVGWQPMPLVDLALAIVCAVVLFSARLLLVIALRHLTAYAVTPLMNLQFVWMVVIGMLFFNETPAFSTLVGVVIVMVSGGYLVFEQAQVVRRTLPSFSRARLHRVAG